MKPRAFRIFMVLLIMVLSCGCGYHVAGRGEVKGVIPGGKSGGMPWGIETLSIPFFANFTGRPDIEAVITGALVDEFVNIAEIVPPGAAQARMEGEITVYKLEPVSYTKRDVVQAYRLKVVMSIRLVRTSDGEVLWQDTNVKDYEDFSVNPDSVIDTKDAELTALKKIARDRARLIRERIIEDF